MWGKGLGIERALEMCRDAGFDVLAILDNDPAKWGTEVLGVGVADPRELAGLAPESILVVSMAFDAVTRQAASMGFPLERMFHFPSNPLEAMRRLGGEYAVCHYDYTCAGEELCVRRRRYRVCGKVVQDVASPHPVEMQRRVVSALLEAYRRAEADARKASALYRVGENWGAVLRQTRKDFYAAVREGDVEKLTQLLGNFCRNDLSSSIMGGAHAFRSFARHQGQEPWLQQHMDVWRTLVDGEPALAEAAMPPIGNPYGYDIEGAVINWNSFVNHARAFRALRLLEEQARPIVAEIGGGFGGFAYHLLRTNRPLTYVNFDLPENLFISSYYLSLAFPDKKILLYDNAAMGMDRAALERYDAVLVPNFILPRLAECCVDLFLNTISFSEMEHATIGEYYAQIDRTCGRYFYHENLACHPAYKGFPVAVFPKLKHFRQLFASFVPWHGMDANAIGHSYVAQLYERRD
jgi:putative sugar O-methyltransferase